MNREIKFRAWDGEHMISPDCIDRYGVAWWETNSTSACSNRVMQYIGLKDKNGKEIYEGDIVDLMTRSGKLFNGVVRWSGIGFNVDPIGYFPEYEDELEVIGNIYKNPELLTE